MKVFTVAVISVLLLASCLEPESPPEPANVVTYRVDINIDDLSADIRYADGDGEVQSLDGQSIPWELEITPGELFKKTAYVKAVIQEETAFVPFASGQNTQTETLYLIDSTADFVDEEVVAGDMIYKDPAVDSSFAEVKEVESSSRLMLNRDYYSTFPENYYIYHELTLTVSILHNGEVVDDDIEEGYKHLEAIAQASIGR